jgi:hypothetical protein
MIFDLRRDVKFCVSATCFLILIWAGCITMKAQSGFLKGIIIDEKSGNSLAYGNILNFSRHYSNYSDTNGEFILGVNPGDTLVLSAVGYYYQKIIVNDSLLNAALPARFVMRPRTYEISEARIVRLGTYDEFRQKFINLDKPKTQTEVLADELANISREVAKESFYNAQANKKLDGITLLTVPILTPEEKERIELARILEEEKVRELIYKKFNPEVVKKITGLKKDDEIIEFMQFCDFSDEYLLGISEYELMEHIALKYGAFKRKKQRPDSVDQPVNLNQNPYNLNAINHS